MAIVVAVEMFTEPGEKVIIQSPSIIHIMTMLPTKEGRLPSILY